MDNLDFQQLMEKYNRELLEMQKKSKPLDEPMPEPSPGPLPVEPPQEPEPVPEQPEEPQQPKSNEPVYNHNIRLDNEFVSPRNETRTIQISPSESPEDSIGRLQVQVYVSDRAEPVQNALVVVAASDRIDAEPITFYTNNSGETPVIELPTVSASLSQQPEDFRPYSSYDVTVSSDGYFTIQSRHLPVFEGQVSILPVQMIPLPENYLGNQVLIYDDSASGQQL